MHQARASRVFGRLGESKVSPVSERNTVSVGIVLEIVDSLQHNPLYPLFEGIVHTIFGM